MQLCCSDVSENEKECDHAALQPPGRSASRQFPHNETEIERTGMNHQPFDDVVVTPEMRPSQGASFVHVSEAAFYPFSTLAQKSLSTRPSDAPPVLVDGYLVFLFTHPVSTPTVRL